MNTAATKNRPFFYSAGKRKTAIARVRLYSDGSGAAMVNGQAMPEYFTTLQTENALAPLALTSNKATFDIDVNVTGGGKTAQSDAVRHGISRALLLFNPELRSALKPVGFLRRDARIKERKKPGLHRARRAPQFSKR
jgi:small subunit ribosomal protein S9